MSQRGMTDHMTFCPVYKLGDTTAWRLAGHWSVGDEQLYCASLAWYIIIAIVIITVIITIFPSFFLPLFTLFTLASVFFVLFFPDSLPHLTMGQVSWQLCGA